MTSKFIYTLMLIVPFASLPACSSTDDDDTGAGGTSSGGRSGASGSTSSGGRSSGSSGAHSGGSSTGGTAAAGEGGESGEGGEGGADVGTGGRGGSGGKGGSGGTGGLSGNTGGVGGNGGRAGAGGSGGSAGHAGSSGAGGVGGRGGAGGVGGSSGSSGSSGSGGYAGTAGSGGSAGTSGAGSVATLNNAEVVKVLATANQGEVAAALVAQPAAQRTALKNFAAMMITDHSNAYAQTLALVSSKHIAPQSSDVSEHLETEAATLLVTLSQTSQADFDRVYMQSQVAMHQEVLTLIDTRLLPDATDPDLKALLTTVRVSVNAHLQAAQAILASF